MKITDFTKARADADEYLRLKEWRDSLRKVKKDELSVKISSRGGETHVGNFYIDAGIFADVIEAQMELHAARLRVAGVEV